MSRASLRVATLALVLCTAAVASEPARTAASSPADRGRQVAITLDDLPYAGASLPEAASATERLIGALARHGAQATIFVEGRRVEVEGETKACVALLQQWQDAGHALANHGYGHLAFNDTPVEDYLADVGRGQAVIERIAGRNAVARQFRAPYNQTGATGAAARALRAHLAAMDVRLTPFTVDHTDWLFNAVYEDALRRGEPLEAGRVADAYIAQVDRAFAFAHQLSLDTFDRPIPQIFLIHANRINADHLDAVLQRLHGLGYAFVSLDEAMQDPVYADDSPHVSRWGISWLHRWRADRGLPSRLRDEPEPPPWVSAAHAALDAP